MSSNRCPATGVARGIAVRRIQSRTALEVSGVAAAFGVVP